MKTATAALLLATLCAGAGCRPETSAAMSRTDSATVTERGARLAAALARPVRDSGATETEPIAKWLLGTYLLEISGLALTGDGRLLAHADEGARIFELDYRAGRMVRTFDLGKEPVVGDFEGITSVNDTLYLLTSTGVLYGFQEGANGSRVAYIKHDTGLKDQCEFEGVAFDPSIRVLLMACKNVLTKGPLQDSLVIYRWKIPGGSEPQPTRLTVFLAPIIGPNGWKGLHPSDITVDPTSGNYVLVAADEGALIQITPSGELIFARKLPPGLDHAEGVAITKDGILVIGTEGRANLPAAVTLFRWP
jgi:uncharacterized protein YjiK